MFAKVTIMMLKKGLMVMKKVQEKEINDAKARQNQNRSKVVLNSEEMMMKNWRWLTITWRWR